jgi:hypothetical protein
LGHIGPDVQRPAIDHQRLAFRDRGRARAVFHELRQLEVVGKLLVAINHDISE